MLKVNLGVITTRKQWILMNNVSTRHVLCNLIFRIFTIILLFSKEMVMTLQEKVSTMIVLCMTVFGLEAYNNRIVIDLLFVIHLWHSCDRNIVYHEIMIYWWYKYHISRNYDRLVINYLAIKNERLIFYVDFNCAGLT